MSLFAVQSAEAAEPDHSPVARLEYGETSDLRAVALLIPALSKWHQIWLKGLVAAWIVGVIFFYTWWFIPNALGNDTFCRVV